MGMKPSLIADRGVFSSTRAASVGIGGTALRQLVRAGECFPLHRGWYSIWRPKDAKDLLRLRTVALLQEYSADVVASHASAVVLLDLPTEGVDFGTAHLMWREEKPFQAFSRVRLHEQLDVPGLAPRGETVHPALACIQVGMADPRALIVAADAALRTRLATKEQLRTACRALQGQRGITRARVAVEWCDERHESPGESLTAFVLHTLGYDFEPQFCPGTYGAGGQPERVDFRITGTMVVIEFDGRVKYEAKDSEGASQLLFLEKQREDRIRDGGYQVVRLTWADLYKPELVRAKIEAALQVASRRSA